MNAETVFGCCILLLMMILPGGAIAIWTIPRLGVTARLGAALALSPPLAGGAVALLHYRGVDIVPAGIVVLGIAAFMVIAGAVRERRRGRDHPGEGPEKRNAAARMTIIAALLAAVLVGSFSLTGEWWRVFSDAWFHGPIVESIRAGGIPPDDPHFAGFELNYPYIYHEFTAFIATVTDIDPFLVMAWLQIFAIISVVLSLGALAHRMHARRAGWTLAFVLLGLNALFPLFLLAFTTLRAGLGEVRGIEEFGRIFQLIKPGWDGSAAFLRLLGGQGLFLDKFMVTTPLALSLAAVCAWAGAFWRWFGGSAPAHTANTVAERAGARGELLLAGFLTLSAGLLHAVVGPALVVSTIGVLLFALIRRAHRPGQLRAAWRWTLAVIIGSLPTVWYLATMIGTGGSHNRLPLDLAPFKIFGLLGCLAAGLIFGARPAARLFSAGGAGRMWIVWMLTMLGMGLIVRLPGPSAFFTVDKFAYLVWIPLAVTAGASFGDTLMRVSVSKRIVLLILLFVPVNGFALMSRITDPHAAAKQPWHLPAHVWMRRRLPRGAVLLTPPGDMNISVFARRAQYYGDAALGQLRGYPIDELHARRRLLERLYRRGDIDPAGFERLERLDRPVYAVWLDSASPIWNVVPGSRPSITYEAGRAPPWGDRLPTVFESTHYTVSAVTDDAVEMLRYGEGESGGRGTGDDRFTGRR